MGHLVGKDLYHRVGRKMDSLEMRVPMNEHLYEILKEVFTPLEAEVFCQMPYRMSKKKRISRLTNIPTERLEKILHSMSTKGLIIDLCFNGDKYYLPSPMIVGFFEFTMMRTEDGVNSEKLAKLFHNYLNESEFYELNLKNGETIGPLRALPNENASFDSSYTEILDYEKAYEIVNNAKRFAIGLCSCRHEKYHINDKKCDIKLDTCASFNTVADSIIRNKLGIEVSKTEALENLAYGAENGLVVLADNVKRNVSFMCHCCGCCCNALSGISRFGYPNMVVTSTFIGQIDVGSCTSCGRCARDCPIDAIKMVEVEGKKRPQLDREFCLGCGVCSLKCKPKALRLVKRDKRVLHPENTFERVLLQCLEKGTLQNLLFDDQSRITMKFMSGLVGGFLRLSPVKKALMSDLMRSQFLEFMRARG